MSNDDATIMAKKIWGPNAAAKEMSSGEKMIFADYPYHIMGSGKTWEAAFAVHVAEVLLGRLRAR